MNSQDLTHFAALLKQRSGIVVDDQKDYLISSRLAQIAGTSGFASVDALLSAIRTAPNEAVVAAAIEAMTTNETFFFRDQTPFDHLRRLLVDQGRRRDGPLRIWSAACSTGQEPYSIAMLWEEVAHHLPGVRLEIVATDLSPACLAKAQAGIYSKFEVQRGLPVQKLMKHFSPVGENWQVKPELKTTIAWRRHNLLDNPWALGKFDVVFCRNVMIYFDTPTRTQVLERIAGQMPAGGHLILGAAESLLGLNAPFKPVPGAASLHQKIDRDAPRPALAAAV